MDHQPKFFENLSGTGKAIGVLTSGGDAQGSCSRRSFQSGGRRRECGGELRTRWGMGAAEREGERFLGGGVREAVARRASQAGRAPMWEAGEGAGGCNSACEKGVGSVGSPWGGCGKPRRLWHMEVVEMGLCEWGTRDCRGSRVPFSVLAFELSILLRSVK